MAGGRHREGEIPEWAQDPYGDSGLNQANRHDDEVATSAFGVTSYDTVDQSQVGGMASGMRTRRADRQNEEAEREALQALEKEWEERQYVDAMDRNTRSLDELAAFQDHLQGTPSQEAMGWQDASGNAAMLGALQQMQGIASAGG